MFIGIPQRKGNWRDKNTSLLPQNAFDEEQWVGLRSFQCPGPHNKLIWEFYSLWECFSKYISWKNWFFFRGGGQNHKVCYLHFTFFFPSYCVYTLRNMTLSFHLHRHQVTEEQQEMGRRDHIIPKRTFMIFPEFCVPSQRMFVFIR